MPATLPWVNGIYTMTLSDFTAPQLAPLTVWYSGEFIDGCEGELTDELAAGVFAAGSGRVAIEAWDYFNVTGTVAALTPLPIATPHNTPAMNPVSSARSGTEPDGTAQARKIRQVIASHFRTPQGTINRGC